MNRLNIAVVLGALAFVGCGGGGTENVTDSSIEEMDRLCDWPEAADGILVWDRNGDGQIQQEDFFGNQAMTGRVLPNGLDNGVGDLSLQDVFGDSAIDRLDYWFPLLRIWKDANGNGVVDSGELRSLYSWGMDLISLTERKVRLVSGKYLSFSSIPLRSKYSYPESPWQILVIDLDGNGLKVRTDFEFGFYSLTGIASSSSVEVK